MSNYRYNKDVYGTTEYREDIFQVFEDKQIRHGFIRKVYTLLSLQLLITCGMASIFILNDSAKKFMFNDTGQALMWVSIIGMISMSISLACCSSIARKYPHNYFFLALFTLFTSYMVSGVTSLYDTNTILLAAGATLFVTIGLTIFACQTKLDVTGYGMGITAFIMILMFTGLINIFVQNQVLNTIYAAFGALIFSFCIIYDTQLIVGGKHRKYQYSPDDYVFATISLYLDIVNLFMYLLNLLDRR